MNTERPSATLQKFSRFTWTNGNVVRTRELRGRAKGPAALASHRLRRLEEKIAHQKDIIAEVERDDHPHVAEQARRVLATYEELLRVTREQMNTERLIPGLEP
jgi:uncharacterized coiled-coil protein SlyX